MDWINVKDRPFPKDGKDYLALFKGRLSVIAYDEETDKYHIAWTPMEITGVWEADASMYEHKISYWIDTQGPDDY